MLINIASFGYFGLFLAREMAGLGHLGMLYTNLPSSRIEGVGYKQYQNNMLAFLPYVAAKMGFQGLSRQLNWPCIEYFDNWVANNMTNCEVFHSFSSFGRVSHSAARERYGAMTVVERGSSHIIYQEQILREEYHLWGLTPPQFDRRIIEKEVQEYAECDRVVIQSSFAERTFIKYGVSKDKLIKLPLGVDLNRFYPVDKEDDVFRVLYAGSMSIRKGSLYLLKAIEQLRLPNFEFVFNGHVADEIKELVKAYSNYIRFVGSRPFNQLYKLYSQASVFVLPTIEDGFAKVVTEAMACGVPVIATTNCGAEDVLTDGVEGFIVPIRDPMAIKEKIMVLYENPNLREQMAQAALKKARVLLNTENHADRSFNAYAQAYQTFKRQ